MAIAIRPAVPVDAAAIARLNAAYDDLRATPEQIAAQLLACAPNETAFLAEVDGRAVGMACLRLLPTICDPTPYAELTELFQKFEEIAEPFHRRRRKDPPVGSRNVTLQMRAVPLLSGDVK